LMVSFVPYLLIVTMLHIIGAVISPKVRTLVIG